MQGMLILMPICWCISFLHLVMSREMLEIEQFERGLSCRLGFSFELPMIADGNIMILSQGDGDENEAFPLSMPRLVNSAPTMQSLTFSMTRGRFSGVASANPHGTLLEVMSNDKQQKISRKLITSTLSFHRTEAMGLKVGSFSWVMFL